MRYTHNLRLIRGRKHSIKISLIISLILLVLIGLIGFTELDARKFFFGFTESFFRVSLAYLISLLLALVLALVVPANKRLESALVPILDVLQSFPSFALFPLLVLWLGKSGLVTVVILIVAMIWPILFTILSAQKQLREDVLEAAQIFGARGKKYLWYVLLPLLLPAIVTGSIVAWGEAWETIIAAEIIVNIGGVGTYLANLADTNSSVLAIGITLLLMLLYLFNKYTWLPLLNLSTRYQQE